jgi:hypothetical protein
VRGVLYEAEEDHREEGRSERQDHCLPSSEVDIPMFRATPLSFPLKQRAKAGPNRGKGITTR